MVREQSQCTFLILQNDQTNNHVKHHTSRRKPPIDIPGNHNFAPANILATGIEENFRFTKQMANTPLQALQGPRTAPPENHQKPPTASLTWDFQIRSIEAQKHNRLKQKRPQSEMFSSFRGSCKFHQKP